MTKENKLRVRRSIQELQQDYENGHKKPLEDLMRAWKGIKELDPQDPHSFFRLGGYHGEPFRGAGWGSASYWGGYCNHGNILFPTWHRVYLLKLEEALQSIRGCEDVMLPYWDETAEDSQSHGIPWALTQETFPLDGETIPNPLRSFVFNANIDDHINGDNPNYSKPKGYETVRYPLSGLVGTPADQKKTAAHNAKFPSYDKNVGYLNQNIVNWLTMAITVKDKPVTKIGVAEMYKQCLNAPNYTVFSNTSSASQWNDNLATGALPVVPLEQPHNNIHLAVGGYDVPTGPNAGDASPIEGANGDMGENDTAGLDPIFYFHHCFVDHVFWLWQKRHNFTDHLEIIDEYPGTNSVDGQGATPGTAPNSWLSLKSPLDPFKKKEDHGERPYTSLDCVNIEKQLGYTYSPCSLDAHTERAALKKGHSSKVVRVSGVNRAPIRGSFVIHVFATIGGKRQLVGVEGVLSRWSVKYCANCQTHLEVKAFVPLHGLQEETVADATFDVEIHTRDGVITDKHVPVQASGALHSLAASGKKLFHVEVR